MWARDIDARCLSALDHPSPPLSDELRAELLPSGVVARLRRRMIGGKAKLGLGPVARHEVELGKRRVGLDQQHLAIEVRESDDCEELAMVPVRLYGAREHPERR